MRSNTAPWPPMAFAKPEYSREQVNAAGKVLRAAYGLDGAGWDDPQWDTYWAALDVINNWRASHGHPLNSFAQTLRNSAERFDSGALIAQRTKRLVSIAKKLHDRDTMKLTQMQDIGGCRAVMRTVAEVHALNAYYENDIDFDHEAMKPDNYIANPKPSGYRGIHLIYRYKTTRAATSVYNDMKIEIQIRSRYQHAWATCVETVGSFVGQALKSSQGKADWLEFFKLMGTVIATREKCQPVPGTPTKRAEIRDQLKHYATKLDVDSRLRGYTAALQTMTANASPNDKYFLMELDATAQRLNIRRYKASALAQAQEDYAAAEKKRQGAGELDSVLVSVDSAEALSKAYPNYFADTRMFVRLMNQELAGVSRGISIPPLRFKTPDLFDPPTGAA